jgi:hypothetical protein
VFHSYGSDRLTRNLLPNGFYKFVVSNVEDLDLLLMHNRKYCAEVICFDFYDPITACLHGPLLTDRSQCVRLQPQVDHYPSRAD